MTNILTDRLPDTVQVGGQAWPINTDYRAALRAILAFEDNGLTWLEKQAVMLAALFGDNLPPDPQAALMAVVDFLNADHPTGDAPSGPRLYSFGHDAPLIYAAYRQTHGLDLTSAKLHWWAFLALFGDLGRDTTFCQLVGLRKRIKGGKASKEDKQAAREMGDMFSVPEVDNRTLEEREQEAAFMRLMQRRKR